MENDQSGSRAVMSATGYVPHERERERGGQGRNQNVIRSCAVLYVAAVDGSMLTLRRGDPPN